MTTPSGFTAAAAAGIASSRFSPLALDVDEVPRQVAQGEHRLEARDTSSRDQNAEAAEALRTRGPAHDWASLHRFGVPSGRRRDRAAPRGNPPGWRARPPRHAELCVLLAASLVLPFSVLR